MQLPWVGRAEGRGWRSGTPARAWMIGASEKMPWDSSREKDSQILPTNRKVYLLRGKVWPDSPLTYPQSLPEVISVHRPCCAPPSEQRGLSNLSPIQRGCAWPTWGSGLGLGLCGGVGSWPAAQRKASAPPSHLPFLSVGCEGRLQRGLIYRVRCVTVDVIRRSWHPQ